MLPVIRRDDVTPGNVYALPLGSWTFDPGTRDKIDLLVPGIYAHTSDARSDEELRALIRALPELDGCDVGSDIPGGGAT
jgi:hypothetical protein